MSEILLKDAASYIVHVLIMGKEIVILVGCLEDRLTGIFLA